MKLLSFVALLCFGFMPQAVAKPRNFARTHPYQVKAASALLNSQSIEGQPLVPISHIPRLSQIERPLTYAEWLAQEPTPPEAGSLEVVQVTGVQLNPTPSGLSVILETRSGQQLQAFTSSQGNTLIAEIPNAVLTLPEGKEFRALNPVEGITSVIVTQLDANRIRVRVTGNESAPTAEVVRSDRGLVFSLTPVAEQEIERVVTGDQETGYSVPDASTATRTDTPIRDIPQSIQVVPQQVIKDQNITRISDATRNVSGVTLEGGFGGNTDNYNIRGFTTYDNLRDGFRSPDFYIDPSNIERVEVLKGPASVLYGQFQPGGVVNYITKQPLSDPYYAGQFTIGNYDFYRPSLDFSGPLNSDRSLLYRLNAAYENFDSFIDFVDGEIFSISPVLKYKIGESTTLALEYEYDNIDRSFYDGFPPQSIFFEVPISRNLGEPSNRYKRNLNSVNLTLEHRFSDKIRLRSAFAAYLSHEEASYVRPTPIEPDSTTINRRFVENDISKQTYSLQTDLVGEFNTGSVSHQLLLGLEWIIDIRDDRYLEKDENVPPLDIFNPVYGSPLPTSFDFGVNQEDTSDTVGIYLQDQVTLLSNLKLMVGGRFDFLDCSTTIQDTINGGDLEEDDFYDSPFSPRVGIVYQPIEPISLYASYSRSFDLKH